MAYRAHPTFMTRIYHIRHPDLTVIGLPVPLLGNPLLLAAAVGRGIVAAGTLRIAGILLGLGGIALVVRLRGIGRLVILLLGVIGLLVLAVGFFLLLGLGSRGLRRLFFAWLLFVFIHLIEMDRSYYASIEVGRRNVSLSNLSKIANGFNISIAALMTGVSDKLD